MSITVRPAITNGPSNGLKPSTGKQKKPETPEVKRLKVEQERLKKKTEEVGERIQREQKRLGADPNADPMYLYGQVQPLLSSLRFLEIQKAKTELVPNRTKMEGATQLSLYKVLLVRTANITIDNINKIKLKAKNFESIEWMSGGLCLYLWYEYQAPPGTETGPPAATPAGGRSAVDRVLDTFAATRSEYFNPYANLNQGISLVKGVLDPKNSFDARKRLLDDAKKNLKSWFDDGWDEVFLTIALNGSAPQARNAWDLAWTAYAGRRITKEKADRFLDNLKSKGINVNLVDELKEKSEVPVNPFINHEGKEVFLRNVQVLDGIANELRTKNPILACAIDKICNTMEKSAVVIPQSEILAPFVRRERRRFGPSPIREPHETPIGQPAPEDTSKWEDLGKALNMIDQIEEVSKKLDKIDPRGSKQLGETVQKAKTILDKIREKLGPHE